MKSESRVIDLTCPLCGNRTRIKLWPSVNAVDDPELAERLLTGSLFDIACSHCRELVPLDHGIQFADPARRVCYRYETDASAVGPPPRETPDSLAGYALRIAPDLNSLKELAHIWHAGLDDAAMLLIKHLVAGEVEGQSGQPPLICCFDRATEEPDAVLEYVVIAAEGEEPTIGGVPLASLREVERLIVPVKDQFFPAGQWIEWSAETARSVWNVVEPTA